MNNESVPYISVQTLRSMQVNDDVIIIDSREAEEYKVSRIEGAIYVGYDDFSEGETSEKIKDRDTPIVVYCSLGVRSEDIGAKLMKLGYTNVRNLYGGIFEWKNNGYPVIDSEGNETENVHAYSKLWGKWLKNGTKVYD